MANEKDLKRIGEVFEQAKKYLACGFTDESHNKFTHLRPSQKLVNIVDEGAYKRLVLAKLKEIIASNMRIFAGNEKTNPGMYNEKPPINAAYVKSMLSQAKAEIAKEDTKVNLPY